VPESEFVDAFERLGRAKNDARRQYDADIEPYAVEFLDFCSDPSTLAAERVQNSIGKFAQRIFAAELEYGKSLENAPEAMAAGLVLDLSPDALLRRAWQEAQSLASALWKEYFTTFRRRRNRALGPQTELDARLVKRYLDTISANLMPILNAERRRYRLGAEPGVKESRPGPAQLRKTEGSPQIDEASRADVEHDGHCADQIAADCAALTLNPGEDESDDPIAHERQALLARHQKAFMSRHHKKLSDDALGKKCGWADRSFITSWKANNPRCKAAHDQKIRKALRALNPDLD
jgi:hypothetical protein